MAAENTVCCSVLQGVAQCCSVLHRVAGVCCVYVVCWVYRSQFLVAGYCWAWALLKSQHCTYCIQICRLNYTIYLTMNLAVYFYSESVCLEIGVWNFSKVCTVCILQWNYLRITMNLVLKWLSKMSMEIGVCRVVRNAFEFQNLSTVSFVVIV